MSLSKRNGVRTPPNGSDSSAGKAGGNADALSQAGKRALDRERAAKKEVGRQLNQANETLATLRRELSGVRAEREQLKKDRAALLRVLRLEREGGAA
ncbi:hypothetical protein [Nocardia flavorosea]|uniref:hypothetical protein n=1 Tax=Nocardia flavorosea TaxID=53429 RepID=UPI002459086C|nr:hypothetical protein [Nocardia flavorosea]